MYILAGNDISKINTTVNTSIKKYGFESLHYSLNDDNFGEILGNLKTTNLFGDRILMVVDITDSEPEVSEKFIEKSKEVNDIYVLYLKKLDSRTKFAKFLLANKALVFEEKENISPFEYGELVINQKIKESYVELKFLESKGLEYVVIFSGLVAACRNLMNSVYNTNSKKNIFPNKVSMYQNLTKKFKENDVKEIYRMLSENDLKFKRGEITDEMMVMSSMNFILKYGSN